MHGDLNNLSFAHFGNYLNYKLKAIGSYVFKALSHIPGITFWLYCVI